MKSLVASVQLLSNEMQSIREENKELRALMTKPTPISDKQDKQDKQAPVVSPQVTLPELRAMADLVKTVDRRVDQFGLLASDDSESENEGEPSQHSTIKPSSSSRPGKLKSGREAKPTTDVLYPQLWPQSFLCLTRAQREVKYDDLTMAEFVAGYAQILLSKNVSALEHTERQRHLVSLMYFAQQYAWSAVLNFHGSVLLEIERGLITWGDSFLHLESRTLYGHPLQEKPAVQPSQAPTLFCRDFQRGQ